MVKLWIVCREVVNLGGVDGLHSEEKEEEEWPGPGRETYLEHSRKTVLARERAERWRNLMSRKSLHRLDSGCVCIDPLITIFLSASLCDPGLDDLVV